MREAALRRGAGAVALGLLLVGIGAFQPARASVPKMASAPAEDPILRRYMVRTGPGLGRHPAIDAVQALEASGDRKASRWLMPGDVAALETASEVERVYSIRQKIREAVEAIGRRAALGEEPQPK